MDFNHKVREWVRSVARTRPFGQGPDMPPVELAAWESMVSSASVYLEFGAGGSTLSAARLCERVISVESSRYFLDQVRGRVEPKGECHLLLADIGPISSNGGPYGAFRTRWRSYPRAPWTKLKQLGWTPDAVLIDGRFRVACALEAIRRLGPETQIIVDDFDQRPWYGPILDFAADARHVGRLLVFRPSTGYRESALLAALDQHYSDHR